VNYEENTYFKYVTAANAAVDRAVICVDLGFAAFASGNLLSKAKSLALRNHPGKTASSEEET
jgi:hypothetical protein